ncbi:MAG: FkbM family methyltransferase [Syntrophobacteraceae bacterium]|nr:FkbM family methyltransferase [Syntrophobacteraceae bacterium]
MPIIAGSLKDELIRMLEEDETEAKKRERSELDRLAAPLGSSIVLFGAGGLGQITLRGLRKCGIEPVAFVDNNRALWDKAVAGVKVMSPESAAAAYGRKAAFVVTIWRAQGGYRFSDLVKQLNALGCERILSFGYLFWKYAEAFLPYYAIDLPHKTLQQSESILDAFEIWGDEQSRLEFVSQVKWRLTLDFDCLGVPVDQGQYFPDDLFALCDDEIFIDCGAFDGDTVVDFIDRRQSRFQKIVAFEPDPRNKDALNECIANMPPGIGQKIEVHPLGLGARREMAGFDAGGSAGSSLNESGETQIEIASLDEVMGTLKPTYIKMDIEGAEPDALTGSATIIRKYRPILAFSVYHQFDHLWKLPLLVRSFYDGYRFFLRAHGQEGWDLVCYAVPAGRLAETILPRVGKTEELFEL